MTPNQDIEKLTKLVDAPPVNLPTIPCSRQGCENVGTHMVLRPGDNSYSFWCEADIPTPPPLIKPEGVQ